MCSDSQITLVQICHSCCNRLTDLRCSVQHVTITVKDNMKLESPLITFSLPDGTLKKVSSCMSSVPSEL